jgi:hypothetical protein
MSARNWGSGALDDRPVPGDYDGDQISDFAVWRPESGVWFILRSTSGYANFLAIAWGSGSVNDIPVPGDYDGDQKTDLAVWRPGSGMWFIKTSSSNFTSSMVVTWGSGAAGDMPVPADYDGDGKADIAVWRPSSGQWFILRSHMNNSPAYPFVVAWGSGAVGDRPVVGDYDGDGAADLMVWRGPTGVWYQLPSSAEYSQSSMGAMAWGLASVGDQPVAGDYDGDGRTDLAVWRGPTGRWYVKTSPPGGDFNVEWGNASVQDMPVPR